MKEGELVIIGNRYVEDYYYTSIVKEVGQIVSGPHPTWSLDGQLIHYYSVSIDPTKPAWSVHEEDCIPAFSKSNEAFRVFLRPDILL